MFNGQFHIKENLPEGVKAVRFDPVEGLPCMVRALKCVCDGKPIAVENINGVRMEAEDVFYHVDPQYMIPLPDGGHCLELTGECKIFKNKNECLEMYMELQNRLQKQLWAMNFDSIYPGW